MKKNKLFSILTSLTVTGSMILSAVPFGASAAGNPVKLALTAEKDTYAPGDTVRYYVDCTSDITEADGVYYISFKLTSDSYDKGIQPTNLIFSEPNQLATDKGNSFRKAFAGMGATTTGSIWTTTPPKTDYLIYNYLDADPDFSYAEGGDAAASILSAMTLGAIRTGAEGAGEHIAEFDVQIPEDFDGEKYTISFSKAVFGVSTDGGENCVDTVIDVADSITVNVDSGSSTDDVLWGDANENGKLEIRDCAFMANKLANQKGDELPYFADFNRDGKVNIRDAAALAAHLAAASKPSK